MEKAQDRLEVLEKIREYEKNGWFDRDVENDPPTRPLRPGEARCCFFGDLRCHLTSVTESRAMSPFAISWNPPASMDCG